MDLWVVAAVTGAGYLGKYWQNLSGEKDGLSDMYSIHNKLEPKSLLHPIVNQRKLPHNDYSEKELDSLQEILASTSGSVVANTEENYGDSFDVNGTEVLPGFWNKEASNSKKRSLKSRRSSLFIVRPLDISESCLTSELNEEHGYMEENDYILPPLTTSTVRPLLVIDGNRVTNRISRDSFDVRFHTTQDSVNRSSGLIELPRKPEQRRTRSFHSQDLSQNEMLPFYIGISIGVMSTFVANKREVDRLNGLLIHNENLVQDLHDELEMKESMKVKEINPSDNYLSLQTDNCSSFKRENNRSCRETELPVDEFKMCDNKKPIDQNAISPNLMSKIEAELVAELETLELNMKSASFQGISDFVEFDPDFIPDVVQCDLKLHLARADSDDDASGTRTTRIHNGNYAVSPIELRLRLHELIESRLQARIQELEIALKNSSHQLRSLESQTVGDDDNRDRPLVIYAYDEIYEQTNGTHQPESEDDDEIFAKFLMKQTW